MALNAFDIIFITIEICNSTCAFIGNLSILIIFFYDESLKIKRNFFLCSLAFSNILRSLVEIPLSLVIYFGFPHDLIKCLLTLSCLLSIRMMTNYIVAAIAWDRFQAVSKPFRYRTSSNISTAVQLIFCAVFSLTVGFSILGWHVDVAPGCYFYNKMDKDYYLMYSIVGVTLPCLALFVIYGMIYHRIRQIHKDDGFLNVNQSEAERHKKEMRATLKITLIVLVFVICGMPLNIANVLEVCGIHLNGDFVHSCVLLAHLNSAIDPILYAYGLPDFHKSFKKLIRRSESLENST